MKQLVLALVVLGSIVTVARGQAGMLFPSTGGSYVNVASTPALSPQNAITVESWFYVDPTSPIGSNRPAIVRKDPSGSSYILRNSDNNNGFLEWILWTQTSGISTVTSPNLTPVLSWHHYAGTYDGSMMRMYLDGVQIASTPKTGLISIAPGPVTLGQGGGSSDTWNGYIDEIRIWSVARTQAQIQSTMSLRIDNQPGLIAAWHFDGNFLDLTGNHNGTAVANPLILPATSPVQATYLLAPTIAPIGGAIPFQLFASPSPVLYVLDVSTTGTMPGTPVPPPGTGVLPLNEPFLNSLYGGLLPGVFQNFIGTTNLAGTASAAVNLPALPQLVGVVVSSAFVTLDGSAPNGIGTISNPRQTTITDYAPFIGSIVPATSPTAGGWPVTISGSHFQQGATVRFDGALATNVVVTPTAITCLTPPGVLGPADVLVQNPDGNQATSGAFSYVATLSVSGTNPVVAAPGATMTVTGGGFTAGLTASLGGVSATVMNVTPGSFGLVIPPGVFCNATLVVSLPDLQTATLNGVNPAPTITNVIGPPGVPSGGSSFFILGTSFHPGTTVMVGGAPAAIVSLSTTAILATSPPGTTGPAQLLVTSAAGCGATSVYFYQ
jgi:Concanavalin A-like lectin/glucanases superfamily/IPT/TIG domain